MKRLDFVKTLCLTPFFGVLTFGNENKRFRVGDRVKNLRLGVRGKSGTVYKVIALDIAYIRGHKYQQICTDVIKGAIEVCPEWKKIYPDFAEKNIYYVRLDKPDKIMSIKEYNEFCSKGVIFPRHCYKTSSNKYNDLKEHVSFAYPEDDLVLI